MLSITAPGGPHSSHCLKHPVLNPFGERILRHPVPQDQWDLVRVYHDADPSEHGEPGHHCIQLYPAVSLFF